MTTPNTPSADYVSAMLQKALADLRNNCTDEFLVKQVSGWINAAIASPAAIGPEKISYEMAEAVAIAYQRGVEAGKKEAIPPAGDTVTYSREIVNNWMGEHDVVLKSTAYNALRKLVATPAPAIQSQPERAQEQPITAKLERAIEWADMFGGGNVATSVLRQLITPAAQVSKADASESIAANARYPRPDSPHGSVMQRWQDNDAAFRNGYRAALARLATPAITEPAPAAQGALTDAQIEEIMANWARTSNSHMDLCRAIEAATRAQQDTASDTARRPVDQENARWAIDYAMACGANGVNKPPSDSHWLMAYWKIGADTSRLDFIESNPDRHLRRHKKHWSFMPHTNYEYDVFKTVREAIDAARAAIQAQAGDA